MASVAKKPTGMSRRMEMRLTSMGQIMALTPRMSRSEAGTAFGAREYVDDHLRQRRAKCHDGQADDERGQLGADTQTDGPVDEPVCAQNQRDKTEDEE